MCIYVTIGLYVSGEGRGIQFNMYIFDNSDIERLKGVWGNRDIDYQIRNRKYKALALSVLFQQFKLSDKLTKNMLFLF